MSHLTVQNDFVDMLVRELGFDRAGKDGEDDVPGDESIYYDSQACKVAGADAGVIRIEFTPKVKGEGYTATAWRYEPDNGPRYAAPIAVLDMGELEACRSFLTWLVDGVVGYPKRKGGRR